MSLILDALRKSEAERKRGQAPGLHSAGGMQRGPGGRRIWPMVGVTALLAGVGAWWWLGTGPSVPTPDLAGTEAQGPLTPDAQPETPGSRLQELAGTGTPSALPASGSLTTQPLPERESQPVPASEVRLLPASMGGNGGGIQSAAQSAGGEWPAPELAPPATAAAQPMAAAPPTASVPLPAPVQEPVVSAEVAVAAPPPTAEPPRFNQQVNGLESMPIATSLPPGTDAPVVPALPTIHDLEFLVRRELPKMQLTMHVFSADPAARFALINGKRYYAGGEAIEGKVQIAEIRNDGLVCEFNGQRFLLPRQ